MNLFNFFKMKFSLCLTTCFSTDITKLEQTLASLICEDATSTLAKSKRAYEELIPKLVINENLKKISLTEPVELCVMIDQKEVMTEDEKKNCDEVEKTVNKLKCIRDLKIVIKRSEKNLRVSNARNALIDTATGDFIKFSDDDDYQVNFNEMLRMIDPTAISIDTLVCRWDGDVRLSSKMPVALFINRKWLIENSLYFIPNIGGEDIIWRCEIFEALRRSEAKAIYVNECSYLHFEKSYRSQSAEVKSKTGIIKVADELCSNDKFYNDFSIVAQHWEERFGSITPNLIHACHLRYLSHGYPIIGEYLASHSPDTPFARMRLISDTYPFVRLSYRQQEECFALFKKYTSPADLYQYCNINSPNEKETMRRWLHPLPQYFGKRLDMFAYRYMCLLSIGDSSIRLKRRDLVKEIADGIQNYVEEALSEHNIMNIRALEIFQDKQDIHDVKIDNYNDVAFYYDPIIEDCPIAEPLAFLLLTMPLVKKVSSQN